MKSQKISEPPNYLQPNTKKFFKKVMKDYALEPHHVKLLILCCIQLETAETARATIAAQGSYYLDRYENPRANPAINVLRDASISAAKILKDLNLDIEPPKDIGRPPNNY